MLVFRSSDFPILMLPIRFKLIGFLVLVPNFSLWGFWYSHCHLIKFPLLSPDMPLQTPEVLQCSEFRYSGWEKNLPALGMSESRSFDTPAYMPLPIFFSAQAQKELSLKNNQHCKCFQINRSNCTQRDFI